MQAEQLLFFQTKRMKPSWLAAAGSASVVWASLPPTEDGSMRSKAQMAQLRGSVVVMVIFWGCIEGITRLGHPHFAWALTGGLLTVYSVLFAFFTAFKSSASNTTKLLAS